MKLELSVWAADLPNVSGWGKPSPLAILTVLHPEPGVKPTVLGQTEVAPATTSPDWSKTFRVEDFELGRPFPLVISVYDGTQKQNKPMGAALFDLGAVLAAPGGTLGKEIKGGGYIACAVQEASTSSGQLHFRLRACQLVNTEGLGHFQKSDPYFEWQRLRTSARTGGRVWDVVYRSSHVENNLHPIWEEAYVDLNALCGGQRDQKLRWVVYDHDEKGSPEFMGEVQVSVQELIDSVNEKALSTDLAAVMQGKSFQLTKKGKPAGSMVVAVAEITGAPQPPAVTAAPLDTARLAAALPPATAAEEEAEIAVAAEDEDFVVEPSLPVSRPTFVQYVRGGCELRATLAVDCTASNGDPRTPASLHHFRDQGRNDYQEALYATCFLLAKYDSDQKFPLYGFGAKRQGVLQQCFSLGPTEEVDGVEGILQTYTQAFRAGIVMSSPRDFSEVIRKAAEGAQANLEKQQSYTTLLIVTNGVPADLEKTLTALDEANTAPLSIVIVGVGDCDFAGMDQLEKRYQSKPGAREQVRFVKYAAAGGDSAKLGELAVDHLPEQLVSYFVSRGIAPQPAQTPDEIVVQPYEASEDIEVPIQIAESGQVTVQADVKPPPPKPNANNKLTYNAMLKEGKKFMGRHSKRLAQRVRRHVEHSVINMAKQSFK